MLGQNISTIITNLNQTLLWGDFIIAEWGSQISQEFWSGFIWLIEFGLLLLCILKSKALLTNVLHLDIMQEGKQKEWKHWNNLSWIGLGVFINPNCPNNWGVI